MTCPEKIYQRITFSVRPCESRSHVDRIWSVSLKSMSQLSSALLTCGASIRLSSYQPRRQPEKNRKSTHVRNCGQNNARGRRWVGPDFPHENWDRRPKNSADQTTTGHSEKDDETQLESDRALLHRGEDVHANRGDYAGECTVKEPV
jgi:hypothetical protein